MSCDSYQQQLITHLESLPPAIYTKSDIIVIINQYDNNLIKTFRQWKQLHKIKLKSENPQYNEIGMTKQFNIFLKDQYNKYLLN